ncbi:MFS transporter [Streptomyces melanogenes]|uniref:MFS transporter n=1 Tax=Streptomyces melanogenes TaxID=67326 RepID=UPI00167CA857|nr:MFS transporter [Streptomyces melanogenes]GGP84107.1 MFS transporter [Streptomyces melanogenes]
MTIADTTERPATRDDERVPLTRWLAVVAMAVGTFALVTVESLPVGLLPFIGESLDVSEGTAGLMVTVPGLVASVTAPLFPVVIGRLDRRAALIGLITLMVLANGLSAAAPDFVVLLGSRFLVGISIGGFWALAVGLAVRLVPERSVPRAVSLVFGGATAANVLGVPAGTLIGGLADWRTAFVAAGALGLLVLVALLFLLPPLPAQQVVQLRTLPRQFRNPVVRAGVLSTFLLVGGHFAAFTFVSPILRTTAGIGEGAIGPLLLGFGVAGILGNFLAAAASERNVRTTILTVSVLLTAILAVFPFAGRTPVGGALLLMGWGLAFGGVPVAVQTWILKAAPDSTEAATALNTSVYNLAIALGALFGAIVATHLTLNGVLITGAVFTLLTSLAVRSARRS